MTIVAILATLLVVILQIITLSVLKSTNKKVDELAAQKSNSGNNDRDRRDRDFRQQQNNNRRPAPDAKPKIQNQPATTVPQTGSSVEQVEKSLRDINLKLKNAERDQENARKKIQSNYPQKDRDPNFKKRDNRDGSPRGGNNRSERPDRRDRRGGNNWQDRNNRNTGNSGDFNRSSEQPAVSDKPFNAEENPMVNQLNADVSETPTSTPSTEPMDFAGEDSLQHGRKVAVKRRMLKEEDSVIESTGSESAGNEPSQESSSSVSEGSSESDQSGSDSDIKFGRR
jgi:hypothetical protein